jgi:hypothetical protein
MKHVLDINVPRSRQIRVELWHIGNFRAPGGHGSAFAAWPAESTDPAPKSVFPWKNNGLRDAQLPPQGIKLSLTTSLDG